MKSLGKLLIIGKRKKIISQMFVIEKSLNQFYMKNIQFSRQCCTLNIKFLKILLEIGNSACILLIFKLEAHYEDSQTM